MKRLYTNNLPIQMEYFVENVTNGVDVLREAEEVNREKFVINHLFKDALNSIIKTAERYEKPLDASKGDVKKVVGNKELLETINELSKKYDNEKVNKNFLFDPVDSWKIHHHVILAKRTYLYLSNMSKKFTDAYRNNNLLVMSYYKALVSNLFAFVGEVVAYSMNMEKGSTDRFYNSLRVKSLKDFVVSYENGSIDSFIDTSKKLLENYGEGNGKILYESYDILNSGMQIIKRIVNNLDKDGKIGSFAYKAIDFMNQILALKQMLWPLIVSNLMPKINEYISLFKTFVNDVSGEASSTNNIAQQIISNSKKADDRAETLINSENNNLYGEIQKNWNSLKSNSETSDVNDFVF